MGWWRFVAVAAIALVVLASGGPVAGNVGDRRITYVGKLVDRPDLEALGFGRAGHWFAQFDAPGAVEHQPTGDHARDVLPEWVAAFNHTEDPADPGCTEQGSLARGCLPGYGFRTFSQDGPARSFGGFEHWPTVRLPGGDCGTAGAIVDPKTFSRRQEQDDPTGLVFPPMGDERPTNNNTINRVQLRGDVPPTFYVGVVTDSTSREYDADRLEIRGNVGLLDQPDDQSQVEPEPFAIDLSTNGVPDVHVFRVDGFLADDYLKLRLRGNGSWAGFSGLLFDEEFDPVRPRARHPRPPC